MKYIVHDKSVTVKRDFNFSFKDNHFNQLIRYAYFYNYLRHNYVILSKYIINKEYSPFSATINADVSIFPQQCWKQNIMLTNEITD